MDVAKAALQRARLVDRAAAGERVGGVDGGRGGLDRVGRGEAQRGPQLDRDLAPLAGGRPGVGDRPVKQRAPRPHPGLGPSDPGLGRRPLGELAGAQGRRLRSGDPRQVVERAAGDPERDRGDRRGEEAEGRERVQRAGLARALGEQRCRPADGDREPVDGDVVAARRPQAGDRPGVDHLDLGRRHQREPDVGPPARQFPGPVAVEDDAAAHQPIAVVDVAGEAPASADHQLAGDRGRPPRGREHPADDAGRIAVDGGARGLIEIGGEHPGGGADGDAPPDCGVADGERLDRLEQVRGGRLAATERRRHAEAVEARARELGGELGRQAPLGLGLGRELGGPRRQRSRGFERGVGHRRDDRN